MTGPVHSVATTYEPHRNLITGVTNRRKGVVIQNSGASGSTPPPAAAETPIPAPSSQLLTPISSYSYVNDLLGRRETISQGGEAFAMLKLGENKINVAYNDRSEVVGATYRGSNETHQQVSYDYDAIGNRRSVASEVSNRNSEVRREEVSYKTNALNQYQEISVDQRNSAVQPSYDLDGNLIEDDKNLYTWDSENRLVRVESKDGDMRIDYTYDYQSRRTVRIETKNPGKENEAEKTTYFIYDDWNLLAELESPPSGDDGSDFGLRVSSFLTWGRDLSGTLQGAGGVGGLIAVTKDGRGEENSSSLIPASRFFLYDANGNVSQLLDESGTVTAVYSYDPFGNVTEMAGAEAGKNLWRFSTMPVDYGTDWLYYGYRWLDTETGRWVNRDPIEEQGGVNLYGFVGNDGVGEIDSLGLAKNTKEQCQENLNSALEDPTVKKLLSAMRDKENCGVPSVECEECCKTNPDAETWGGYHTGTGANGGSSTVRICYGGQADKGEIGTATYLRHELVHAYDACDGDLDCEAAACSEVRAYRLMGGKMPKPGLFPNISKQNIRARVLKSLMSNEACGSESERALNANAALNSVFDQCYEDFSPLY